MSICFPTALYWIVSTVLFECITLFGDFFLNAFSQLSVQGLILQGLHVQNSSGFLLTRACGTGVLALLKLTRNSMMWALLGWIIRNLNLQLHSASYNE